MQLQCVSQLAENQTDAFPDSLKKITVVLSELITNQQLPSKYVYDLLKKWLECLEQVPGDLKYRVYRSIDQGLMCVSFFIFALDSYD